jgi:hypothetical protein
LIIEIGIISDIVPIKFGIRLIKKFKECSDKMDINFTDFELEFKESEK